MHYNLAGTLCTCERVTLLYRSLFSVAFSHEHAPVYSHTITV